MMKGPSKPGKTTRTSHNKDKLISCKMAVVTLKGGLKTMTGETKRDDRSTSSSILEGQNSTMVNVENRRLSVTFSSDADKKQEVCDF